MAWIELLKLLLILETENQRGDGNMKVTEMYEF